MYQSPIENDSQSQFSSKWEIERADNTLRQDRRVEAKQKMQMPQSPISLQRKCENCEEEILQMQPYPHSITPFVQMKKLKGTDMDIERGREDFQLQSQRDLISNNPVSNFISKGPPQAKAKKNIQPTSIGGDTQSDKIIRIAWTFDDGPTGETGKMKKSFSGAVGSTWYIQYHHLKPGNPQAYKKKIAELKSIQSNKGEIAIHGLSENPQKSHAFWFPSNSTKHNSYKSIQESMKALEIFYNALVNEKITVKFVRLPGGLISEISSYLSKLGAKGNIGDIARAIIKGEKVSGTEANKVKKDFEFMKTKLQLLGLHLWGGSKDGDKIMNQSWEAETSGDKGRTDNTTLHVHSSRIGKGNGKPGKFERTVDIVTKEKPRSLVVLAHDTTSEDANEVGKDNEVMNSYAKSKKVKIEYHTMSNLFKLITGQNP